ncbi:hypothetical protein C2U55_09585 [Enterobacteriaceae bacterium ENNIH3]|nr:hypothetical protein C2U55_09585 [Enterobacteriaceae bacterium ENNIH3]AUV05347.1 hypothetical protein C2U52_03125 [Enterobacteriaceae bacterium ENNIH2]PWF52212.1 hypothetical protein BHT19_0015245 [[Kluyvera] intestini]
MAAAPYPGYRQNQQVARARRSTPTPRGYQAIDGGRQRRRQIIHGLRTATGADSKYVRIASTARG